MNKAIYMPKGAAGEYAKYACNFYKGCSNGCSYCYLKRGVLAKGLGGCTPVLKSCFKDENDAIAIYFNELFERGGERVNPDIQKHGVFFTFTSDPCLPETVHLNLAVIDTTMEAGVPVKMLTKCTGWIESEHGRALLKNPAAKKYLSVGFTLTGRDDLEPNAAPNSERIKAMADLHEMGIRTWASVEPVISLRESQRCIEESLGFCDEYKIGLLSGGKRNYTKEDVARFIKEVNVLASKYPTKVYWKESVQRFICK